MAIPKKFEGNPEETHLKTLVSNFYYSPEGRIYLLQQMQKNPKLQKYRGQVASGFEIALNWKTGIAKDSGYKKLSAKEQVSY